MRADDVARQIQVLLNMLFLIGQAPIIHIAELGQVPAPLVLDLRRPDADVEVALQYLVPVEILNHQIQIVLVVLQDLRRLAIVRILEDASVSADVPVAVSVSQRRHTLRIVCQIACISVVDLIPLRIIELLFETQYLAASDIQRLVINIFVLLILSVRRVVIVIDADVGQIGEFVFAGADWTLNILRATLPDVRHVLPVVARFCVHSELMLLLGDDPTAIELLLLLSRDVAVLQNWGIILGVKKLALGASCSRWYVSALLGRSWIDANIRVVNRLVHRIALFLRCQQRPVALRRSIIVQHRLSLGLYLIVLLQTTFVLFARLRLRQLQFEVGLAHLVRIGLGQLTVDHRQVQLVLRVGDQQCSLIILARLIWMLDDRLILCIQINLLVAMDIVTERNHLLLVVL